MKGNTITVVLWLNLSINTIWSWYSLFSQSGVVELCLRTKESIHAGIGFYVFECPIATRIVSSPSSSSSSLYLFLILIQVAKRVLTENLLVGKSKFVIGINQGRTFFTSLTFFTYFIYTLVSTSFTIKKTGCIYAVVPSTYVPRIEMTFSLIFSMSIGLKDYY
jgi:hypothetical protein